MRGIRNLAVLLVLQFIVMISPVVAMAQDAPSFPTPGQQLWELITTFWFLVITGFLS